MLLGAGKKDISKGEVQYPPLLLVVTNIVCRGGQSVLKNPFTGMVTPSRKILSRP